MSSKQRLSTIEGLKLIRDNLQIQIQVLDKRIQEIESDHVVVELLNREQKGKRK
jgi:hypothetical protein